MSVSRWGRMVGGAVLGVCGCLMAGTMGAAGAEVPTFSLSWSEYPSWSVFGVAHEYKLINGKPGELGTLEKKWGVDIELKEADYDTCLVMYGAGKCDATCLTNTDALNPSLTRKTVCILPTSTSDGADACLVTSAVKQVTDLKGKKVFGLAKSVSEYCFVRNLELLGQSEKDYSFVNMDPAAAALQLQQAKEGVDAIVVWNPYVLETLNKAKGVRVLFDSSKIPGEIIDMVVMGQDSLDRPGADKFALALIDTFYEVNKLLAAPATRAETLVALGEKFSHLDAKAMETVVTQTKFYATPQQGLAVLAPEKTKDIMAKVAAFSLAHDIVAKEPKVGYGAKAAAADADFRLDDTWLKQFVK